MKVLLHSYNTCFQNPAGGMQSRIQLYKDHLAEKDNLIVDYFSPTSTKIEDYDILHLFRLDIENYSLVQYAKKKNLGIVISSVVPLIGGRKIDLLRLIAPLPIQTTYKMSKFQLDAADAIITETFSEKEFINDHYQIVNDKISVIPNGIEINASWAGEEIFDRIGFHEDYVLTVGRIDPNKNQLNLIRALKNTNIQLIIIGGPDNNSLDYYNQCLNEAKVCTNIHILGWVDHHSNLLKSAYSHCKMFVLPSYKETFGMSVLEAISYGSNIAISDTLPICEYPAFACVKTFNPGSINSIKNCITSEFDNEMRDSDRNKIINEFSWDSVINRHITCYNSVLYHI